MASLKKLNTTGKKYGVCPMSKILINALVIFFTIVSVSMFGFYLDVNSFVALTGDHLLKSCVYGFIGLLFSYLIAVVI